MGKKPPELSKEAKSLKIGKYQHYNGSQYKVLGVGFHSETLDELVIYQSLKDNTIWMRPLALFTGNYINPPGNEEKRFIFIKES